MGLGRSRSCSWIVEIADVGARRLHHPAQAGEGGTTSTKGALARPKASSFDEAAVEASLALPLKGARQRASEAGLRPSPWPNTPQGGSARRKALDQEPTGPRGAGSPGKPGDITATPKLGARRQARPHPRSRRSPKLRLGKRPWKPPPEAKVEGGVIRESSGPQGARIAMSVAEVGRRIFPARAKRAERCAESPQGSLTRRSLLDEENRFAVGKRVRGERGQTNSKRARACFGRKA
jgi:hypothetical protein